MIAVQWGLSGIESGLLYVALAVFFGASVVGVRVLRGRRRGQALGTMLAVGTITLGLLILALTIRLESLPIGHRFEGLVVTAWILGLVGWLVERRMQLRILPAVAAPTLFFLLLMAVLLVRASDGNPVDMRIGTVTHILLALFGFAAFAFASGVAVLYLWQIRVLKSSPAEAVGRGLPPLEVLDNLNFLAVAYGFPLLALSMLGGWVFLAGAMESPDWWLDPTVLATMLGLLVYLTLFLTRTFLGWYGRRIAWLTIAGFLVIVLGFVVGTMCTGANAFHTP